MGAEIYYFSGTGNSLAVARDINQGLNGKLISIKSIINKESINSKADVIGIVFPIYYEPQGGVPLIVRKFANKLENIQGKYIFAICTYGSLSINALDFLDELIQSRGGKVAGKFTVNMPSNMSKFKNIEPKKQEKMINTWKENIHVILEQINNRANVKYDTPNLVFGKFYSLIKLIIKPIAPLFEHPTLKYRKKYPDLTNLAYEEFLPYIDRTFKINDNCIGCKTCYNICPKKNIEILNGRPSWKHNCEFCLACIHWCKKDGITSNTLENLAKYHHPHIRLEDMTLREYDF